VNVATIDPARCDRSPACPARRVCPQGAVSRSGWGPWEIDPQLCTGCGACIRVCPTGAISINALER